MMWILLISIFGAVWTKPNIIPLPRKMETGNQTLILPKCRVRLEADSLGQAGAGTIQLFRELLFNSSKKCNKYFPVEVKVNNVSATCTEEKYTLQINETGIFISSECLFGIPRALATLLQLSHSEQETLVFSHIPLYISDSPRFEYRGLMIDFSRHFLPLPAIQRVLTGMMLSKLNVLHIHISDDDSYPLESHHIPGFEHYTSFSKSQIYSIKNITTLIEFARIRGIRIVPEFDTPGHSVIVGKYQPYREIVTCLGSVWPYRGLEKEGLYRIHGGPSTGALDPSMNETYEFVGKILQDLFEYFDDEIVHLGGDEVLYKSCWGKRKTIVDFMKKHNIPDFPNLQSYYIEKIDSLVKKLDPKKKRMYWLYNVDPDKYHLEFAPEDILQYWGLSGRASQLLKAYPHNKFVLSPIDRLYLNCGVGNKYGGTSSCGEVKYWLTLYLFEPSQFGLDDSVVLGAEACAWGEINQDVNLDLRFWPQVGALAETLWSPKRTGEVDLVSLVKRINALAGKLREQRILAQAITSQYCEIHTEECFKKY